MRKTTRRLLLAGLAILLGAAAIGTVSASGPRRPAPLVPAAGSADLTAAAASAPTAWFVELQDPPAGVAWADAIEAESETGAATSGAIARAQAAGQFQLDIAGDAYGTTSDTPSPDPNPMDCNGPGAAGRAA